ncbi:MAG: thioredoxin domain-containing protein [Chitinispirillaceae bacterium]|nr:thioredoxin domain-containing protein [Chitinispirillaceae bacterium]
MIKNIIFTTALYLISTFAGVIHADRAAQNPEKEGSKRCCDSLIISKQQSVDNKDLSKRLEKFKEWLCSSGKSCQDVQDALLQRCNLYLDTNRSIIETEGYMAWQPSDSAIKIVVYISLNCPLCKRLYSELIDSLSNVPFGKRVSLTAVPFTIGEADRLYSALFKQGRQIALLRALYPVKERVTPKIILHLADSLGVDTVDLIQTARSSEIVNIAARSREAGIAAGVKVTPTFFINNVRYNSYKDIRWILDYLEVIAQKPSR